MQQMTSASRRAGVSVVGVIAFLMAVAFVVGVAYQLILPDGLDSGSVAISVDSVDVQTAAEEWTTFSAGTKFEYSRYSSVYFSTKVTEHRYTVTIPDKGFYRISDFETHRTERDNAFGNSVLDCLVVSSDDRTIKYSMKNGRWGARVLSEDGEWKLSGEGRWPIEDVVLAVESFKECARREILAAQQKEPASAE